MSSQELVAQSAVNGHHMAQVISLPQRTGMSEVVNAGAVAIEQERAIAEAQGQLVMAKRFPRNLNNAHEELMMACSYPSFAAAAFYSVPNRGSGPSIRFAEEVARVYGNFEFGHRELSRSEGKSEVEVYAWDKEKNNLSKRQITVMHVTDTRNGPKKLTDQADIDNKIANVASKQVRGRILALLPKWLVEDAVQKCKDTLAGNSAIPIEKRLRDMQQAFAKFGVTSELLERYLGHKIEETLSDELADLTGVYNALKEGTPASEFFGAAESDAKTDATAAALAQSAQAPTQAEKPAQRARATRQQAAAKPTVEADAKNDQQQQQQQQQAEAVVTPEDKAQQVTGAKPEQANQVEPDQSEQLESGNADSQLNVAAGATENEPDPDALAPAEGDVF